MRKRNRFARVGVLSIALLLSLCVMGVGYSAWTDTISVDGTVETASWGGVLSGPFETSSQNITLRVAAPGTLHVSVIAAQANTEYTGSFQVNNAGTVPINIESIVFDPSDITATVSGVSEGDQLDPGETKSAVVHTSTPDEGNSYDFTITFAFALWNE